MDDQNKKNDYDDFFKPAGDRDGDDAGSTNRAQDDKHEEEGAGKSSYYYSYGPFKPGAEAARGEDGAIEDRQASVPPSPHNVEVTPPTQLRPFAPSQSARGWQPKESRRSPFKAMFASFLVGVVAVGSLMYVSDKQNWFTSEQALSQQSASSASSAVGKAGDSGSVSSAADVVRPNNIAQLFEKASPAVVKIETFTRQQSRGQQGGAGSFDDFFSQFFGDENGGQGQDNGQGQGGGQDKGSQGTGDLTPEGIGTGFFFDSSGYILTNEHVVDGADEIHVTVQGTSEPYVAKKLGSDYNLDLAVLKVEGKNPFPTLPIGDSNKIDIGDWVVAIGNPYGFDHTVTVGVLSAKERPISIPDSQGTREYQHLLQTDASINPGNSGGPLLNLNGEVVGINTAVSSQAQGIGFAIPTSTITEVLDNLKSNTAIPKKPIPFIGATLAPINDALQKELELSNAKGSVVSDIIYKSPAYMADLRQYDVITGLDGKSYDTPDDLIAAIKTKAVGDKVKLNIVRNGQKMDLTVTIGNKNDFEAQTQQQQQEQQNQ